MTAERSPPTRPIRSHHHSTPALDPLDGGPLGGECRGRAETCSAPGDFATGCSLGPLQVACESQRFPGFCACLRPDPSVCGNPTTAPHRFIKAPRREPVWTAGRWAIPHPMTTERSPPTRPIRGRAETCSAPGDFATGCSLGPLQVACESQRFPGFCACLRPDPSVCGNPTTAPHRFIKAPRREPVWTAGRWAIPHPMTAERSPPPRPKRSHHRSTPALDPLDGGPLGDPAPDDRRAFTTNTPKTLSPPINPGT
jgi:hypothetical protein